MKRSLFGFLDTVGRAQRVEWAFKQFPIFVSILLILLDLANRTNQSILFLCAVQY